MRRLARLRNNNSIFVLPPGYETSSRSYRFSLSAGSQRPFGFGVKRDFVDVPNRRALGVNFVYEQRRQNSTLDESVLKNHVSSHIPTYPLVLCSFAAKGDFAELQQVLESNPELDVNRGDYDARTPLHLAAEEGFTDVAKLLLRYGANVNAIDRWGNTPLLCAFNNNHHEIISLLKDYGASFRTFTLPTTETSDPSINVATETPSNRRGIVIQERLKWVFDQVSPDSPSKDDTITREDLTKYLMDKHGLNAQNNVSLRSEIDSLVEKVEDEKITWSSFYRIFLSEACSPTGKQTLIERAFLEQLAVHNWPSIKKELNEIYEQVKGIDKGEVASYIPELASVDPNLFGISICTVDGQVFNIGDTEVKFSIQSCAKALLYSFAIEDYGSDFIHKFVGREPSGTTFNAFSLNNENKPHNACNNAGAIAVSALYHPDLSTSGRFKLFTKRVAEQIGGEHPSFAQAVYLSEKDTAHTNFALAHFMASKGSFPFPSAPVMLKDSPLSPVATERVNELVDHNASIEKSLDFYFQVCSTEVNCRQVASIAATYANCGVNPLSGQKVLSFETVKKTMQMLFSCGMYDFSGEWACTVGLPAKSGVSGVIFLVVPNILGIAIFAPPLDRFGNSVKGVEFARRATEKFKQGLFDVVFRKADYDKIRSVRMDRWAIKS